MSEISTERPVALPAPLPFLLNALLSGALGWIIAGAQGLCIGIVLLVTFLAIVWSIGRAYANRSLIQKLLTRVLKILRPCAGLVLLPPTILLALITMATLWLWERSFGRITIPAVSLSQPLVGGIQSSGRFMAGFFKPAELPRTAVNFLLLLIIGTVAAGIQVAFYAALVAVPIVICVLLMVAVESTNEPEEK